MRVTRSTAFRGLPELIQELGGDLPALMRAAGIAPEVLTHEVWAPVSQVHQLLNLAARQLKRRDLGLLWGERTSPTLLGPLYVAMAHADTGRDTLALAARFIQTQTQLVRVTATPRGRSETLAAVTNLQGSKRELIQLSERQVSFMHRLFSDIFGARYAPTAILFDHDQQAEEDRYIAVLGRLPEFNAGANGIVMRNDMLAEPVPRAHPQIRAMAADYLAAMAARGDDSLVDQVTDVVKALLASSDCEAGDAARVLGLEVRTMQRRLLAGGSSFERIKDQVRRDLAEQWLAEPDIPLIQISTMLQYANASAFTRSCRRWFGASPSEHRARLTATNAA